VESGAASVKVAAGVAVVPVFASGAVVASTGAVVSAVGESAVAAGTSTTEGAEKLWDFANSDPAKRPALDRTQGVPPLKKRGAEKRTDPSPATAMKVKA
jgi:hypothetical protein